MPVRENFAVNMRFCSKKTIEIVLRAFACFLFQILYLAFTTLSQNLENNSIEFYLIFELAEENLVVNNKDNRVFMSRNYRSDSCPLEI